MKKHVVFILAAILIASAGCSGNIGNEGTSHDRESTTYHYTEGIYPDKNWSEMTAEEGQTTPSPDSDQEMDKDSAIALAIEEFEKVKQRGICQSYTMKGVFYDTEDHMWIVYFGEDTEIPGGCYNIAISQNSGKVVSMWPGE